jgi:thioredoxin-like negative regulator of GroEL
MAVNVEQRPRASAPGRSAEERPRLLVFHSPRSGPCRRAESWLASALQAGGNHNTFGIHRIDVDERPDLAARFQVLELPTLLVIEGHRVRGRLAGPRDAGAIEALLAPWLRGRAMP